MNYDKFMNNHTIKVKRMANDVFRKSVFNMGNAIIRNTPVDTGRLRGNWQPSFNQPIQSKLNISGTSESPSPPEQTTVDKLQKLLEKYKGENFYFTNNLPYAYKQEVSNKNYKGFVRKYVKQFRDFLEINAKRERGKTR